MNHPSKATWNLVQLHHAPYSSGENHGSHPLLQWPYAQWGAHAVLAGHDHSYERILRDDIVYFVNGLGGKSRRDFDPPIEGSQLRYNDQFGAMVVDASPETLSFRFINTHGQTIDQYSLKAQPPSENPLYEGDVKVAAARITDPMNDVVMTADSGKPNYTSFELVLGEGSLTENQFVGLSFPTLSLPPHARIIQAHLELAAQQVDTVPTSLSIFGTRDSLTHNLVEIESESLSVLSKISQTCAVVTWKNVPSWMKLGETHITPDLSPIVQEIVDQPTWKLNGVVTLLIMGTGRRSVVSCDLEPELAPRLVVVYEEPKLILASPPDETGLVQQKLTNRVYLPLALSNHCR
ncbi:hypothetical protein KFU94_50195 [Chloroflexi bacterium TSY]|nr:hypothetical protein [Chloroflexi bacterium TSY]